MNTPKITVIGLGYVGLPLACLFATKYPVIGFDINANRITKLKSGVDHTLEVDEAIIKKVLKPNPKMRLGLYCSSDTDDMREAPAIYIIKELTKRGAKIQAYDPKVMEEAQHFYLKDVPNISYHHSKNEMLKDADAMILLTEWKEFRSLDFEELKCQLSEPVIFDGPNQHNDTSLKKQGFEYYQIGKKQI